MRHNHKKYIGSLYKSVFDFLLISENRFIFAKNRKPDAKNGKPGNRNGQQNRKTEVDAKKWQKPKNRKSQRPPPTCMYI